MSGRIRYGDMVVVTLGHRLRSETAHTHLRARVDAGVDALDATGASHLLLTGGRTNPAVPRAECEVMRDYAVECGVPPERLLLEDRALDTVGNGYFARLLVENLGRRVESVSVVTADYHAERAAYVFERCFGGAYDVDAAFRCETKRSPECRSERRKLRRTREFFDPVPDGDLAALRRRLDEAHDLYEFGEEPVPEPQLPV